MREVLYHAIVGNDTPPWVVAAARGFLTALLAAATNFFMVWSQTDDVKLLISTPSGVFLSVLTLRWAAEGIIDTWKNGGGTE